MSNNEPIAPKELTVKEISRQERVKQLIININKKLAKIGQRLDYYPRGNPWAKNADLFSFRKPAKLPKPEMSICEEAETKIMYVYITFDNEQDVANHLKGLLG